MNKRMKQQTSLEKSRRASDLKTGLLFLPPTLLIFAVFKYYVLGYNLYLSLTSWNFFSPVKRFIGLKNFKIILSGTVFWKVLWNTLYYTLGTTIISTILGFVFAVLLFTRRTVAGSIFKTIFLFPILRLLQQWPYYGYGSLILFSDCPDSCLPYLEGKAPDGC